MARSQSEKRILICEDDPTTRMLLFYTVFGATDGAGIAAEIREAGNGEEGFRLAVEWRPDLIITDRLMPGRSGDQLLRDLIPLQRLPGAVLAISGSSDDQLVFAGILRQAGRELDGFFLKPFDVYAVKDLIVKLLR